MTTMMKGYIAVQMTEEEAKRYVVLQKYYLLLLILEKINALNVRNGYVQINFDSEGRILSVDKHEHLKA